MVDKADIQEAEAGDKHIRLDDYNEIVKTVNKLQKSSSDPTSIDYVTEDGIGQTSLIKNTRIVDFPFRVQEHSSQTISIVIGNWIRNQVSVELEENIADNVLIDPDNNTKVLIEIINFRNEGEIDENLVENIEYYVYIKLLDDISQTTELYDLTLIPGQLRLYVDRDRGTAHARTPAQTHAFLASGTSTARDIWLKDREIIGTVQLYKVNDIFFIKEIKQRINEDIIDNQIILDSMNKARADAIETYGQPLSDSEILKLFAGHVRQTLETNKRIDGVWKDGVIHFGETQIRNVADCPGVNSLSFPYFLSYSTSNDSLGPAGEIFWASIDSGYRPLEGSIPIFKTLEIKVDGNPLNKPNKTENWDDSVNSFSILSLYGSSNTASYSKSICWYKGDNRIYDQTSGKLDWGVIDSERFESTQATLEIRETTSKISSFDDPHTFQLHKVSNTAPSSLSICFYDAGARFESNTPGELKWAVIDSELYGGDQKSLELREEVGTYDDPNIIQLHDWDSPAASIQPDAADRILVRKASTKTLIYVDIPDVLTQANVESIAITVVTDVRYASPYLQKKTRTIYILESESESSWQTYATAEDCPEP